MAKNDGRNNVKAPPPGQLPLLPSFGDSFLDHHAGRVITDPAIAIVELVANCSDAGADRVEIVWPSAVGERMSITDNGVGMTRDEFLARWLTLNYDRRKVQGSRVRVSRAAEFGIGR